MKLTVLVPAQCVRKKETKMFFCNIFYWSWAIMMKTVSWINLLQKYVNVFHLNWIMTLHYLVNLEMFITQVLPLHCQRKKLCNLAHLNCGLQIHQIWIQLITACWEYCKRRCTKHASLIWTNWNSDWECIMSSLRQPFVSGVVRSVLRVLYISLTIFPTCCCELDSNLANLETTVEMR